MNLITVAMTGLFSVTAHAAPSGPLTLDLYLAQVRSEHLGARADILGAEGAEKTANESSSLTYPSLFGTLQRMDDGKPSPFMPYQKFGSSALTLGVSQQFSFGTQAKVSYNFDSQDYVGFKPEYFEGRPQVEIVQPLWRNWSGVETRANQDQMRATAHSIEYQQKFQSRLILTEAEIAYWRLSLNRDNVQLHADSLKRAEKIHEWNARRAKLQLADPSDLLQAQAALELRKLELANALNDERAAARAFNIARGIGSDEVPEKLILPDASWFDRIELPPKHGRREDVVAAEHQALATSAQSKLGMERSHPTVELFGLYALNSKESDTSSALSNSLKTDHPTSAVGIRFTTSLDLGSASDTRSGYNLLAAAADLTYQRKIFESEQEWEDLRQKFTESKAQLSLTRTIEEVQDRKLAHERDRLSHGRSTTYQVLVFEQDLASAQAARVQAYGNFLQVMARIKLFAGEGGER